MADRENSDDAFAVEPAWDEDRARSFIGKYVLIGISHYEADGETFIEQQQMHGVIRTVDPVDGITVALRGERDGETTSLPPFVPAFEDALPGEYRLRETGEIVVDPDFTTTWKIVRPKN